MTVFAPVDTLASLQVWNWLVRLRLRLAANAVVASVVQTLEIVAGSLVSLWHFWGSILDCDRAQLHSRHKLCRRFSKVFNASPSLRVKQVAQKGEERQRERGRERENDRQRHREAKLNSILMNIDWLLSPWGKLKAIGASAGRSRKFTSKLLSL